jgi:hypothetical protein
MSDYVGPNYATPAYARPQDSVPGHWLKSCWYVSLTYVMRWRFWFFGVWYLVVAWPWEQRVDLAATLIRCMLGGILACFVALHLRRQFATPAAKIVPGFAGPHLAIGAVVSAAIWIAVPSIAAWVRGLPAWGPIGAHAPIGLLLALVVCWRPAMLLLALVPLALMATATPIWFDQQALPNQFIRGEFPEWSWAAIVLAVTANVLAAGRLMRMSEADSSASDDFSVEPVEEGRITGRWDEWLLKARDTAIRRRLADAGFGWWSVQRWRVPGAISWVHLALAVLGGTLLVAFACWASDSRQAATAVAGLVTVALVFAPVHSWHQRRGVTPLEFMRPVTRRQYFGQSAAAFGLDMCVWTVVAAVFAVGSACAIHWQTHELLGILLTLLVIVTHASLVFYAVGLATYRLRFWLPLMAGLCFAWLFVMLLFAGLIVETKLYGRYLLLAATPLAALALVLTMVRRWRTSDVG